MKRWSKRKIFKPVWFSLVIFFFVWRLPQYDYRKTLKLFNLDSGSYVVGGYSQGGKMAAQIVYENPTLKDYFYLGTSHPRDIDLSTYTIPTIKIYAEKDGHASLREVIENKIKLPQLQHLFTNANHNQQQLSTGRFLIIFRISN